MSHTKDITLQIELFFFLQKDKVDNLYTINNEGLQTFTPQWELNSQWLL